MSQEEKTRRLNVVRYGLFVIVVMAMAVTPTYMYIATFGQNIGALIMPTILATIGTAIVCVLVWYGYRVSLERME
ncbi:MAG: hypothetical protein ACE5NP_07885 [Anaerolineae bacterium]